MRNTIGVALIGFGALIVALPIISDSLISHYEFKLMSEHGARSVNFIRMSGEYRFGCWLLGALMIGSSAVVWLKAIVGGQSSDRATDNSRYGLAR